MRLTENLMKQILYLIIIIITLSSCKKTNYTIEGRVLTEVEGEMIYLKVSGEDSNIAIDSTVITNGRFHFGGYIDNPQMGYLYCSNIPNGYPIVIEPGKIEISILNDVRISGTNSNNILNNYLVKFHHTTSKKMEIKNLEKENILKNDNKSISALVEEFDSIQSDYIDFCVNFIEANNTSIAGAYVLYKNTALFDEYSLEKIYSNTSDVFRSSLEGRKVALFLNGLKNSAVGRKYTDVELQNIDGERVFLSDYVGNHNYVLLGFWATWCEPCRRELPLINKIYDEYHNRGVKIVSVSLDSDSVDLRRYLSNASLRWDVLSDYKGWQSKAASTYSVNQIPASLLINKDGVIVARNIPLSILSEELDKIISE